MHNNSDNSALEYPQPQPGEIWEVRHVPRYPVDCCIDGCEVLYSHEARSFINSGLPSHYVMIITNQQEDNDVLVTQSKGGEEVCGIVSVMVLSTEINYLSDVDLLIPSEISGLERNLLAQTWLVEEMLVCNLLQSVGKRISYQVYEILLNVGDYFHGLIDIPPRKSDIKSLGIGIGNEYSSAFHKQEIAWSDVLTVPTIIFKKTLKGMAIVEKVLDEACKLEQDLAETIPHSNIIEASFNLYNKTRINLSRWFENILEPNWKSVTEIPQLAVATRSFKHHPEVYSKSDEINSLIEQLPRERDEYNRRRIAKRLGDIAAGRDDAIKALINLLHNTQDDETLWTAVESLWQLDPGNIAAGVRRVKLIDLGMELAGEGVALAVALVPKVNQRFGVLLQVYPTGRETYLPPQLQLTLLDANGNQLRTITARLADVFVQLKFSGEVGEEFSVRVALGEAEIIEDFVI